jgi:hypothetical protein
MLKNLFSFILESLTVVTILAALAIMGTISLYKVLNQKTTICKSGYVYEVDINGHETQMVSQTGPIKCGEV